jgi:hypothetical protein
MLLLAGILLTVATVAIILSPLVTQAGARLTDGPDLVAQLRELYALREVAYETLRDLEFDFHSGKIAEADFLELSDRSRREALGIVQRIEAIEARVPGPPGSPGARA